jgi:ribonuclease P protein component
MAPVFDARTIGLAAPAATCSDVADETMARFPKSSKLLRHADFQRVYKQGRRQFAAHMTVFYLNREDQACARVGIAVGRALGGAVDRNRIKRRLREAVRHNLAALSGVCVDMVINPKKSSLAVDFELLRGEVASAFELVVKKQKNAEKG